jgi:sulfonate transport system ATP-binding protein
MVAVLSTPDHAATAAPGAAGEGSVALEHVSMTYLTRKAAPVQALADIDLIVRGHTATCIVGASGCGKSTLLRIIAGLELGYRGTVTLGGRPLTGPGLDRGVVFQDHRLVPWMTVERNVAFGLHRLAKPERDRVVDEKLALVGLSGSKHVYPSQLSGGMAQRVALARALAHRPKLLLLDEPFGALDALTKLQLQDELIKIRAVEQVTTILVTHDIEEAIYLGDQVVVLSNAPGRVRATFPVTIERPRTRTSQAFGSLREQIYRQLVGNGA